ncbi:MAG: radical SAM protein [Anaerolineales bacterium]|jgi:predicted DNA-binding helix-hairpin-helix protein
MDDDIVRLRSLCEQMAFEPAEEHSFTGASHVERTETCPDSGFVHPAVLPNGQRIKLLKTLLSSACELDCYYCPFRAGRNFRRATFQPEEFARLFDMLYLKGLAEGVFLSSGIISGGIHTQDKLLDSADILRNKLGFRGYIHLKIMPGAERSQVERAMQLADRVSINLEAPNNNRLAKLAPHKQFTEELLLPLKWIQEIRRTQPGNRGWNGHWPSSVTQFVAGGAGESDLELLTTTEYLYAQLGLRRAYFSAFNPILDTPLENQPPTPVIREHRLYQASFLIRDYGFDLEELPFEIDGRLSTQVDPKLAWAQKNLSESPIEVNRAERRILIRIPGIGPKSAEAILRARRRAKIRDMASLRKIGVIADRAAPYLLIDGRRACYQPTLF